MSARAMVVWVAFVVALAVLSAESALAESWDFTLGSGDNSWYAGHYTQMGSSGFFGPYNVDRSGTAQYASLNGWVGNSQTINQLVSGSNARTSQLAIVNKVGFGNDWVRLSGRYKIEPYVSRTAEGTYVTMSPAQLAMWSIDAVTPVSKIMYGKQSFQKGLGLQFDYSRSQEYLILQRTFPVPNLLGVLVAAGWLPRSALNWFSPHRWTRYSPEAVAAEKAAATAKTLRRPYYSLIETPTFEEDDTKEELKVDDDVAAITSCPNDPTSYAWADYTCGSIDVGFGFYPWFFNPTGWNNYDLGTSDYANFLVYLTYRSDELKMEIGCLRSLIHLGPELQTTVLRRNNTPSTENYQTEGWAFVHYSNCDFFFKSELDWFNEVVRYQRTQTGQIINGLVAVADPGLSGAGSAFASDYVESWRFMVETGAFWGPAGVRGMISYMPGPDRRHGVLIDRQPSTRYPRSTPTGLYTMPAKTGINQTAVGLHEPYSMLMGNFFGGGTSASTYIDDATVYGIAIDYAVAANLNLDLSFLTAKRNSHGYGWGFIRPTVVAAGVAVPGTVDYAIRGTYNNPSPAIPDDDLGWEIAGGFTWAILEGWAFGGRMAYWKPGEWFKYACIDRSVTNWTDPTAANNWGINPDRRIDPMLGIEVRFSGSY